MKKIDLEQTLAGIRAAYVASGAIPDQDVAELAANRDGVDAGVEFAKWSLTQREALDVEDYVPAVGILISSMIIGAMSPIRDEDKPSAYEEAFAIISGNVHLALTGSAPEGSAIVPHVMCDVGDA